MRFTTPVFFVFFVSSACRQPRRGNLVETATPLSSSSSSSADRIDGDGGWVHLLLLFLPESSAESPLGELFFHSHHGSTSCLLVHDGGEQPHEHPIIRRACSAYDATTTICSHTSVQQLSITKPKDTNSTDIQISIFVQSFWYKSKEELSE